MPDYEAGFPDMMGPAYIAFGPTGGEFSFGCVTGAFAGGGDHDAVQFGVLVTLVQKVTISKPLKGLIKVNI